MQFPLFDLLKDIPLGPWLGAFGILLCTFMARLLWDRFVQRVLRRLVERTRLEHDDMMLDAILKPTSSLILASGFYMALLVLPLPKDPWNLPLFLQEAWSVTLLLIVVWMFYRICEPIAAVIHSVMSKSDEGVADQFVPIIRKTMRFTVMALAAVLVIQNLGYQVTSLVAGLGIGGLAVALAAQDTLANIFGTLVMLTDRPFKVGDWVLVGGLEGTVESLGFRSTRIRTFSKSLIVVPNKLLTEQQIENWSAMPKRRINMTLGLTYDTPPDKIEIFVERLKTLLETDAAVDQEFHMVNFTGFGSSSLDILLYFFTKTTVWSDFMNERQRLNLQIMRIAHEVGVSFAFPSQTQYFADPLRVVHEQIQGAPHAPIS
jgi:MscS family membrane protein